MPLPNIFERRFWFDSITVAIVLGGISLSAYHINFGYSYAAEEGNELD